MGVRGDGLADARGEGIDLGGERVDPGEHHAQHECVVIGEVPGERLLQDAGLGAHVPVGQGGQLVRVALPGDQGIEHGPARGPEDVADHHRQLDLGVFEQFLGALLFPGPFLGQGAPVAGQVPQLALRAGRDERGPEHAPLGELSQPDRIELVRFGPAGDVLDVAGVDHPALDVVFEEVERRLPVRRGGLHHHQGHALADQPVPQFQQRRGQRGVGADLLAARSGLVLVRDPDAHGQRGLPDVQCRDALHQRARLFCDLVHDPWSFPSGRFQAGCPREPEGGSEAESRARGNNAGPLWQAPSARLLCGLSGTKHRRLRRAPHPIFTPQGVARDIDDSYVCQGIRVAFPGLISGVLKDGERGSLLGCGHDREGPLG